MNKFIVYSLSLIVSILYIIYYIPYTQPVFAQTLSTPSASQQSPASNLQLPTSIPPTSPIYTDLIVHNMFHTFSCLAIGGSVIGQPCLTYQAQKDAQGVIRTVPVLSQVDTSGGLLGTTTSLITALYANPPVRTADYIASVAKGFGFVKVANAQVVGSGAAVLNPILALWQVSRNISYVIMVIIFVVIGLMVMFRQRINPQTVISAQAALPGLVLGLILITFSYFFASLISDTAFIGTNLVGYYFSSAQPGSTPILVQDIERKNVGSIFSKFVGMISWNDITNVLGSIYSSVDSGVQAWLSIFAGLIGYQTGSSIGEAVGTIGGAALCGTATAGIGALPCGLVLSLGGKLAGGIAAATAAAAFPAQTFGLVFYFIAIAIMIYTMFKLLLRLINSYLTIIFLTVTAPFHFLAAALPGRQGIATSWILNMLSNILAFPAVFAVFYFVAYLWGPNTAPGTLFNISKSATVAGTQTLPLLGGLDLSFIKILLAYGALVATPAIPDIVNRTIGRVSQAGQMLGQEIQGGTRSGQGYSSQFQGQLSGASGSTAKTIGGEMTYNKVGPKWMPYSGRGGLKDLSNVKDGYTGLFPKPEKKG